MLFVAIWRRTITPGHAVPFGPALGPLLLTYLTAGIHYRAVRGANVTNIFQMQIMYRDGCNIYHAQASSQSKWRLASLPYLMAGVMNAPRLGGSNQSSRGLRNCPGLGRLNPVLSTVSGDGMARGIADIRDTLCCLGTSCAVVVILLALYGHVALVSNGRIEGDGGWEGGWVTPFP